jgi:hypothetical protein
MVRHFFPNRPFFLAARRRGLNVARVEPQLRAMRGLRFASLSQGQFFSKIIL